MNLTTKTTDRIETIGFTDDQRKAYSSLIEFIDAPYNPNDFKRALIGAAGTGKTFLVKALIKNCSLSYSQIGLAAPTHKACRVLNESINISGIKVNTLASDLGLKPNFNAQNFDIKNPPFDPKGEIRIGDYQLYILDEASMVHRGLCLLLEKIAKEKKVKIVYIGDGSQLPPVGEIYSPAFRGIKLNELKQVVRQDDTNPVKYLLNLLRYDIQHKTFNFLQYISKNKESIDDKDQGYKVFDTTGFNQIVADTFKDERITSNVDFCKLIAFTNMCVSGWNKAIRNYIIEDAEKSIITKNDLIISYISIVNVFNEVIIKDSDEYILQDVVNYVDPTYELKGFLVRFIAIHGGKVTTPLFIIDHKDPITINKYVSISDSMINAAKNANKTNRAARWAEYYKFRQSCLLLVDIINPITYTPKYSRNLDYGFCLTSHKSQGSTFDITLVDVDDIVYDKSGNIYSDIEQINRRLYVACSRCKNKLYLKWNK